MPDPITMTFGPPTDVPAESGFSAAEQAQIGTEIQQTQLPTGPGSAGNPGTGQFIEDELDAAKARGSGDPFAGFKLPTNVSTTDYFTLVAAAEKFAANSGWQYFPTPNDLLWALQNGEKVWGAGNTVQLNGWFAWRAGVLDTMPWAAQGISKQQWDQSTNQVNNMVLDLTGQSSWAAAGLDPAMLTTALAQGWSSSDIQNHILQNPTLAAKYGYLQEGLTYNSFQAYKATNQAALQSRYGSGFTDANAIQNMQNPLAAFNATGGAVDTTKSKQTQQAQAGGQSSIR